MATSEGKAPEAGDAGSLPGAPVPPGTTALPLRTADFPVVGIGASAGGLAALEAFLSGMPPGAEPGMAFVVVQHLAPDHESLLVTLLQRGTRLKVLQIVDGLRIRPNCVYVNPPGCTLSLLGGCLQLMPQQPETRHLQLPIDQFFKSLADDLRGRAIGVLLSGTGHDGTAGLRAIKAGGGMAMVQSPESAEFDSMPRSAIDAGLADYTLEPAQMPAQLIAYAQHAIGTSSSPIAELPLAEQAVLSKIHVLLRARTGHDFSQYKSNTVARRIERRMQQQKLGSLHDYFQFVQHAPEELDNLFSELLIGVTRFFRDAEAFKALADLCIAPLFASRAADDPVRVWCVGCSTGEEAYSIAMLLAEQAQAVACAATVQIFATDVDRRAVTAGRAGVYPAEIAADLSPERLARFFTAEPTGGWRIQKRIRDSVVFSEQDLLMDPPFSRLDLLVCRNVMIYLDEQLQKRLIPLFHYALKPGGTLFLGQAEGIGEFDDLFGALDRSAKLYRRQPLAGGRRAVQQRFVLPSITGGLHAAVAAVPAVRQASLRELTERALLAHLAPVAALVTPTGEVAYLHGRSGLFLEPAQGDAQVGNILKMAREGLAPALGATLQKAVHSGDLARANNVRVKTNGDHSLVDLVVRPLTPAAPAPDRPLYLVVLSLAVAPPGSATPDHAPEPLDTAAQHIAHLQAELQAKDEYLRSTNDQLQRANEELTSINEEAQSINEELQSTNEELETSKEELQSVNEELITANTELEDKLHRLTQANNDMNNLLAGTGIGTLFVDHGLRVLRFTPALSAIINLIPGDTGRPLAHIVSNLVGYAALVPDCQAVLDTLVPQTHEVQTTDGRWYTLRIQPYRTLDNVIEGAVISFIEVTESVRTREELKRVNAYMRYAALLRDTADAIAVQSLDGQILAWNPAAERLYGWTEAQALLLQAQDRIPPALRDAERQRIEQAAGAEPMQAHRSQRLTKDGALVEVSVLVSNLLDASGTVYAVVSTERPIAAKLP